MNFSVLPPEINSALMFAGAGPGPMLAAASAWTGLAGDLGSAAASFSAVTSQLATGSWQGPASAAMTGVAASYARWLTTAAAQAEQAAGQAQAAVSAFEAALAATVHPGAVSANRGRLRSLVASNLLGQNAPAIAAVEAVYEQMWAADVAAMLGYHGEASAVALSLTPFTPSPSAAATPGGAVIIAGFPFLDLGNVTIGGFNLASGNLGLGNLGSFNPGSANTGSVNLGNANIGDLNLGSGNIGSYNLGGGNTGDLNPGSGNTGTLNWGSGNIGSYNLGGGNLGSYNLGSGNTGDTNFGGGNTGNLNVGGGNTGNSNFVRKHR